MGTACFGDCSLYAKGWSSCFSLQWVLDIDIWLVMQRMNFNLSVCWWWIANCTLDFDANGTLDCAPVLSESETVRGGNYRSVPLVLPCSNYALFFSKSSIMNALKSLPVSPPFPLYCVPVISAPLSSHSWNELTMPGVSEGKEGPSVDHGNTIVRDTGDRQPAERARLQRAMRSQHPMATADFEKFKWLSCFPWCCS